MDILVKITVAGALLSTLICFAIWSQQKLEEYKSIWDKDTHDK